MHATPKYSAQYHSPIGILSIEGSDDGISQLLFLGPGPESIELASEDQSTNPIIEQCVSELSEYFAGTRTTFSVSLMPQGTPFEQTIWEALRDIQYGSTCSYLDIARKINNPNAIRAVGRANGANPIAIIVPCHRVIGSDGSLTGYAGELWRKRWLLDHEARVSGSLLL